MSWHPVAATDAGPIAPTADVLLATTCWACDRPVHRWVNRSSRRHPHFVWTCESCEVVWSGPGEEVGRTA